MADCFVVGCVCGNELWFVVFFLFVFVGVLGRSVDALA